MLELDVEGAAVASPADNDSSIEWQNLESSTPTTRPCIPESQSATRKDLHNSKM